MSAGGNHCLAFAATSQGHYETYSWGLNRHGQLGIGEPSIMKSLPRGISYLQDVVIYNMDCGDYHSVLTIGDALGNLNQETVQKKNQITGTCNWNFIYYGMFKSDDNP